MQNSTLAPVRAGLLCECPAKAVIIASWFCELGLSRFDNVQISSDGEGRVSVTGVSTTHAVRIVCDGVAERTLLLPARTGFAIKRRHPDAEHLAIAASEPPFLQVRTFSADTTVALLVPEIHGEPLPPFNLESGPHVQPLQFSRKLLLKTLSHLIGCEQVQITEFPLGWRISAMNNGMRVESMLAGVVNR